MRLRPIQCEILSLYKLNGNLSIKAAAKHLRTRESTVRYQLSNLIDRGLATRAPFLNIYPLGLRYLNMYFSTTGGAAADLEGLLGALIRSPRVSWLAEIGGDYHFGMACVVRHTEDVQQLFREIKPKSLELIFEKVFTTHLSLRMYPLKFLSSRKYPFPFIGYRRENEVPKTDELELKILKCLSDDRITTGREVARRIGAPHSTVEDRLTRLERNKILTGTWLQVNFRMLGFQSYKLLLYTRGVHAALAIEMEKFCQEHPRVDSFIECIGEWDFEVGLVVEGPEQVTEITRALSDRFAASLHHIKTIPLFRVLKLSQFPGAY
jgi:DNA-binding Lrp family transcriptional regulator